MAAAAGYLAYRTGKKLTGLRDLMRKKAIAEADATVWSKAKVDRTKRWIEGDAKLAMYDIKRNGHDLANDTKLHYNMKTGRDLARKSQWLSARQEHFENIGNTATRRDALRNWANNNGKIVLDNFGYGQYAKRRGW